MGEFSTHRPSCSFISKWPSIGSRCDSANKAIASIARFVFVPSNAPRIAKTGQYAFLPTSVGIAYTVKSLSETRDRSFQMAFLGKIRLGTGTFEHDRPHVLDLSCYLVPSYLRTSLLGRLVIVKPSCSTSKISKPRQDVYIRSLNKRLLHCLLHCLLHSRVH